MYEKRNSDFQDLSKRLGFENNLPKRSASPVSSDPGHGGDGDPTQTSPDIAAMVVGLKPPLSVYETDALFWMVGPKVFRNTYSNAHNWPHREVSRAPQCESLSPSRMNCRLELSRRCSRSGDEKNPAG